MQVDSDDFGGETTIVDIGDKLYLGYEEVCFVWLSWHGSSKKTSYV